MSDIFDRTGTLSEQTLSVLCWSCTARSFRGWRSWPCKMNSRNSCSGLWSCKVSWPLIGGAGGLHGEDAHGGEEGDGGGGGCHAQSEGGNAGVEGRPHGTSYPANP